MRDICLWTVFCAWLVYARLCNRRDLSVRLGSMLMRKAKNKYLPPSCVLCLTSRDGRERRRGFALCTCVSGWCEEGVCGISFQMHVPAMKSETRQLWRDEMMGGVS